MFTKRKSAKCAKPEDRIAACASKKVAHSSALRCGTDEVSPLRSSIARAAISYIRATVLGISRPCRSSKIEMTIESISGLEQTDRPVSASSGTNSRR